VETLVSIVRLSMLSLVVGIALFAYYLRTRRRWAWAVGVVLMTLGILGLTLGWG
jgi:hypothetical protein